MGGSSSQPQSSQPRSPINAFLIEELYTPEFSESLQENTGCWQQPDPYEATTQTSSKRRRRQPAPAKRGSERGNARKKDGFWVEVMEYIESKTKMKGHRTYDMESGVRDEDYVQKEMVHYQGSSKRHKLSGSSSFNTEFGDASINLNNIVADNDEVQEIRRLGVRDKARAYAKNKGSKASGSSTMNDDALARLVVNEMTTAEVEQSEAFI
ncbi:hypothetical protein Tco_1416299 [Tanacetum coccineum]